MGRGRTCRVGRRVAAGVLARLLLDEAHRGGGGRLAGLLRRFSRVFHRLAHAPAIDPPPRPTSMSGELRSRPPLFFLPLVGEDRRLVPEPDEPVVLPCGLLDGGGANLP